MQAAPSVTQPRATRHRHTTTYYTWNLDHYEQVALLGRNIDICLLDPRHTAPCYGNQLGAQCPDGMLLTFKAFHSLPNIHKAAVRNQVLELKTEIPGYRHKR